MSDYSTFADRLASARADSGLSFSQLAERCGMAKFHLWALECGRANNPTLGTVEKIAAALNVAPAELAGWAARRD
jgi:transcriptional regulator with XRE-family HTH domain